MKIINQEIKHIIKATGIIIVGLISYFSLPFIPNVTWVYLSSLGLLFSTIKLLFIMRSFSNSLSIDVSCSRHLEKN